MKKILFVLCLLSTTAAFAQYYGGSSTINSEPRLYSFPSHPGNAAYAPMSQERNILAATSYNSVQGERRPSDFPQAEAVPLGDVARELRKQHAELKKSRVVWINQ